MGKQVNVQAIYNLVEDINKQIEYRDEEISAMYDKVHELNNARNALFEFNNDLVTGSRRKNVLKGREYVDQWRINGIIPGYGLDFFKTSNNTIDELRDLLDEIKDQIYRIEKSADEIVQHTKAMEKELGEGVDKKVPTSTNAFDILSKSISYSADEAQKGKKIDSSEIMDKYWKDAKLSFKKQENGTYAVIKKDENGAPVIMGYTTGAAATAYLNEMNKNKKSSDTRVYTVSAEEQAKSAQAVGKGPKSQPSKIANKTSEENGADSANIDNDASKLMKDIAEKNGIKPNLDNDASKQMKNIAKKNGIKPNAENDASKLMKDVKSKVASQQRSTGPSPQATRPSPTNNTESQQRSTGPSPQATGPSPTNNTESQVKDASTLMSDIAKEKGITPKNDNYFEKFKK